MKLITKDYSGNYLVLDTKEDGLFSWLFHILLEWWTKDYAKCARCESLLEEKAITKETKNRTYVKCLKCKQINWIPK